MCIPCPCNNDTLYVVSRCAGITCFPYGKFSMRNACKKMVCKEDLYNILCAALDAAVLYLLQNSVSKLHLSMIYKVQHERRGLHDKCREPV